MSDEQHNGELYLPDNPKILKEQQSYLDLMYDYNRLRPSQDAQRQTLLKRMLAEMGTDCHIEAPFYSNWGGHHVHLGDHVYANFNLTAVDDTHIYIGNNTMIGPNVTLATAAHPVSPELRAAAYQYNMPIHIGVNCWLGANVTILPGVTIGENTVIGAGSVVTKDMPANVVAFGTPCKVIRPIGERDRETYFRGRKIDWSKLPLD
ncbi:sugar O-acetyltransferase [Secundilactobacillus folii]|uniref:Acetyltransferase n=1 Tax=Secundilactobacillus folii TaxID=2678357 RepID=A0A7X2XT46_9LACO|nr:sugar O-acetyltransferase [Secundilactobacillus folii]MTV81169.1 sugar O-acetyltransferase [Secundilactobacillus folii]